MLNPHPQDLKSRRGEPSCFLMVQPGRGPCPRSPAGSGAEERPPPSPVSSATESRPPFSTRPEVCVLLVPRATRPGLHELLTVRLQARRGKDGATWMPRTDGWRASGKEHARKGPGVGKSNGHKGGAPNPPARHPLEEEGASKVTP